MVKYAPLKMPSSSSKPVDSDCCPASRDDSRRKKDRRSDPGQSLSGMNEKLECGDGPTARAGAPVAFRGAF